MKKATVVLRILLGLLLLFASLSYFFPWFEVPKSKGTMLIFEQGLKAAIYLMPLVKAIELVVGLSYVSGKFVPLANLVFLPISVNIVLVNAFLSPKTLPIGILVIIGNIFLLYRYWNHYQAIFKN